MTETPAPYRATPNITAMPLPKLTKAQWIAIAKILIMALVQIAALFGFDLLPDLGSVVKRIVATRPPACAAAPPPRT